METDIKHFKLIFYECLMVVIILVADEMFRNWKIIIAEEITWSLQNWGG